MTENRTKSESEEKLDKVIEQIPMSTALSCFMSSCFMGRGYKNVVSFIDEIFELLDEEMDEDFLKEKSLDLINFLAKNRVVTLNQMQAVCQKIKMKTDIFDEKNGKKTSETKAHVEEAKEDPRKNAPYVSFNNNHKFCKQSVPPIK